MVRVVISVLALEILLFKVGLSMTVLVVVALFLLVLMVQVLIK